MLNGGKVKMSVKSCENLEKSQVKLTIEVGAEEFEKAVNKAYLQMRGKMNVPGFRPGKPTADFIHKVLNKITMFGALYLAIIAIAPIVTGAVIGVSSLAIGGTSIIIVVGVALETTKALEAQMLMRHYKGFLE